MPSRATGREAADSAFLDDHGGAINVTEMTVTAISDGDLPTDPIDEFVALR
jgi:hypothetical protein